MGRKVARLLVALALFCGLSAVLVSPTVAAEDIFKDACSGAAASATCQSTKKTTNPLTGTNGTLYKVSRIVATIAGVVAVVMIMVSGLRYMTSGGDAQKAAAAKNTLIGALVGLVIIVLAQSIILFVMRRL